jgi:hypothetical protein
MKNGIFFVLLLVIPLGLFGQSLDSLILKGQKGINRVQHLKSFIPGSGVAFKDTARTKNNKVHGVIFKDATTITKSYAMPGPSLIVEQAQRIDELEASVAKITVICDNLQKQSDSHSDNQEFFLKLFEIIFGGFVSIIIAVIGYKFSKKSGQNLPADGPG